LKPFISVLSGNLSTGGMRRRGMLRPLHKLAPPQSTVLNAPILKLTS
jgi:hypothetical protein